LALATGVLFADPASACSLPGLEQHLTDSTTGDTAPPGDLTSLTYALARSENDNEVTSSCGDLAILTLNIEPPESEQAEQIGYQISSDDAPDGLVLPDTPLRAPEGTLSLAWPDDPEAGHSVVAFTISVSAVDLAGNAGPPTELRVYDGGDTEACSVSGPRAGTSSFALLFALSVAVARFVRRRV
jgi:hypothetical protein